MKIKQKITATFSPKEKDIVHDVLNMFSDYNSDDWDLLTQCFADELYVDMGNWFEQLEKIHDYIKMHS